MEIHSLLNQKSYPVVSPLNIKFNIKPILFTMCHKYAYMGPCRYGQGYSLSFEFDYEQAMKEYDKFNTKISSLIDTRKYHLLEPQLIYWNEDFILPEEDMKMVVENDAKIDFYLIYGLRLSQYFGVALSERTEKPIAFIPFEDATSKCDEMDLSAKLFAIGRKDIYPCLDYDDVLDALETARVKKILNNTKIFFPLKGAMPSYGCQSSYLTLKHVTDRFGCQFAHITPNDIFDVMDCMSEDENKEIKEFTANLVKDSKGVHLPQENIETDVKFYFAIKKLMGIYNCNAFTIPCFEICATRELNKRRFTFCLAQSLLKDEGIASACAGDVGSVISINILMSIANKAPHMGNTAITDRKQNQMKILHDVPSRKMKGFDTPDLPIEYVSFAMDNWGATMRYDFSLDCGEIITMINISPDMSKMMIATGTINGCNDYLTPECKLAVTFEVADAQKFFDAQKYVGHHFAWVYGDYKKQLKKVAEAYGMDCLEA